MSRFPSTVTNFGELGNNWTTGNPPSSTLQKIGSQSNPPFRSTQQTANIITSYTLWPQSNPDISKLTIKQFCFSVRPIEEKIDTSLVGYIIYDLKTVNVFLRNRYEQTVGLLTKIRTGDPELYKMLTTWSQKKFQEDGNYQSFLDRTNGEYFCARYSCIRAIMEKFKPLGIVKDIPMTDERYSGIGARSFGIGNGNATQEVCVLNAGSIKTLPYFGSGISQNSWLFFVLKRAPEDIDISRSLALKHGLSTRPFAFCPESSIQRSIPQEQLYQINLGPERRKENPRGWSYRIGRVLDLNGSPITTKEGCENISGLCSTRKPRIEYILNQDTGPTLLIDIVHPAHF